MLEYYDIGNMFLKIKGNLKSFPWKVEVIKCCQRKGLWTKIVGQY